MAKDINDATSCNLIRSRVALVQDDTIEGSVYHEWTPTDLPILSVASTALSIEFPGCVWDHAQEYAAKPISSQQASGIINLSTGQKLPIPSMQDREGMVLICLEAPSSFRLASGVQITTHVTVTDIPEPTIANHSTVCLDDDCPELLVLTNNRSAPFDPRASEITREVPGLADEGCHYPASAKCALLPLDLLNTSDDTITIDADQPVILHMLDISPAAEARNAIEMELVDVVFLLLKGVVATADVMEACTGVNVAVMFGGIPGKDGMERKGDMQKNVSIYKALEAHVAPNYKVLVVSNPANTNAHILEEFAPSNPKKNNTYLNRLDHNRALGQISERISVQV
ncbi:malate dehydrogenase [NADP], chloroplastic-like [Phragmites australis]|uniref:malate dehydrogenase [NADP], chloroplastic-like n=1 Tax=Phragmites australis TaxID=29695 RepID=UPI002D7930EA|nr:malate dehydrogenase [NADP], chloroplastic-like [Phragmites australis]